MKRLVLPPVFILVLFFTAILLLGTHVKAAPIENSTVSYEIKNKTLYITGYGEIPAFSGSSNRAPWYEDSANITALKVSDGITKIGSEAFYGMKKLKTVKLAASVASIGTAAFANCSELENFSAEGLTDISDYAFQDTMITGFFIPKTLITMGDLAFYSAKTKEYVVDKANAYYASVDGVLMNKSKNSILRYPTGREEAEYEVPDKVKTIAKGAFQGAGLRRIQLSNVTTIKENAFQNCNKLTYIKFPEGLKEIPPYAFYGCSKLNVVRFNEDIASIEQSAFAGCTDLTHVYVPGDVEFIHYKAFPSQSSVSCRSGELERYGTNGYRVCENVSLMGDTLYEEAYNLLNIINRQRMSMGRQELVMDGELLDYANQRASELSIMYSNIRPDSSEVNATPYGHNFTVLSEIRGEGFANASEAAPYFLGGSAPTESLISETAKTVGIGVVKINERIFWSVLTSSSNLWEAYYRGNETDVYMVNVAVGKYHPTVPLSISIDMDGEMDSIEVGKSALATAGFKNPDIDFFAPLNLSYTNVIWSSSDDDIAQIGFDSKIYGISHGEAVISVETVSGELSGEITVSVGEGEGNKLFRVYNPKTGEHLYTNSTNERDTLVSLDWKDEGVAWVSPERSEVPVYRVFNPKTGEHHYTRDANEKKVLVSIGWKDEGISWFSSEREVKPVYRLYNEGLTIGSHHYTPDLSERKILLKNGWKDEGVAWYAID